MSGITLLAAGRVGRAPSPEERLARLQDAARAAVKVYGGHRCHHCEIAVHRAQQAIADFLVDHPELAA